MEEHIPELEPMDPSVVDGLLVNPTYEYAAMTVDEAREAGLLSIDPTRASSGTYESDDGSYQWVRIDAPGPDAPCKHEWRQYMILMDAAAILDKLPIVNSVSPHAIVLIPDGFFCIHCTEKRD